MRKKLLLVSLMVICFAVTALVGEASAEPASGQSNALVARNDNPNQNPTISSLNGGDDPELPEIQDILFSEGFENGGSTPAGWTDSPGEYPWMYGDGNYWTPDWAPGAPHSGEYCGFFPLFDTPGDMVDSLLTPSIDLSLGSGMFVMKYWSWYPNSYGSDSVIVYLKEGDSLTRIHKMPTSDLNPYLIEWQKNIVPVNSSSNNARIVFIAYTGWGYGMTIPYIDDITIADAPFTGRCCYGDVHNPDCADNSLYECEQLGGTWTPYLTCEEDPCVPTPVNDQCFEAQAITGPYPQTVFGTDVGATADCPGFLDDNWNGVWYTIDLPYGSNNVIIDFSPTWSLHSMGIDRIGNAWMPNCDCAERNEFDQLEWGYCDTVNYQCQYPVLSGTIDGPRTIYFPCFVGQTPRAFGFTVRVTENNEPPVDFQITAARGTWTEGNTCDAGYDVMLKAGEDQIWEITIPYDDSVWIFSLCNTNPGWNTYMALGTSPGSDDIRNSDDDCDAMSKFSANIDAGVYYLTVDAGRPSDCGPYQLDIDIAPPPPPNDNCENVTPVHLAAGETITFTGDNTNATNDCENDSYSQVWAAFTLDETFNLAIDYCGTTPYTDDDSQGYRTSRINSYMFAGCPCGDRYFRQSGDTEICPDGMPTNFFEYVPAGTYYIPVRYRNPQAYGPYTIHVTATAVPPAPANDNCGNAESVGNVTELAFSTSTATVDGPGECISSRNIWYRYTAPSTGTVKVALCGSSYDTKLAVYDGIDCENLTNIGCNDDSCETGSIVLIEAVAGNQYLIEVGGSGPSYGDGLLTIESLSAGCEYVLGDVNGNETFNGIDVTYMVSYLKGGNPPTQSCDCPNHGVYFAVGDVNGSCSFNGIDVTYAVGYFKGGAIPQPCADCPPARILSDPGQPHHTALEYSN